MQSAYVFAIMESQTGKGEIKHDLLPAFSNTRQLKLELLSMHKTAMCGFKGNYLRFTKTEQVMIGKHALFTLTDRDMR